MLFYSAGPPATSPPPRCEHAATHGMALFACNSPEHRKPTVFSVPFSSLISRYGHPGCSRAGFMRQSHSSKAGLV